MKERNQAEQLLCLPVKLKKLGSIAAAAGFAFAGTSNLSAADNQNNIVSIRDGAIAIGDKPFFPVMVWRQCPQEVEENLAIGVNTFVGNGNSCSQSQLQETVAKRAHLMPEYPNAGGRANVIGYHLLDEPDGSKTLPELLPTTPRVAETGQLVLQTLSMHFARELPKFYVPESSIGPKEIDEEDYKKYISNSDFVGTDIYPLSHSCHVNGVSFTSVYDYQRQLNKLAAGKPTFQWIEVNSIEGLCGEDPVAPDQTNAEVWMSIAGGANGVGYFTHSWKNGQYSRFDITEQMMARLTKTNAQIQKFKPLLTAPQVGYASAEKEKVKIGARQYESQLYIIAVNSSAEDALWNKKNKNFQGMSLGQLGTKRVITAHQGRFRDAFKPYQVKIYKMINTSR